MKYIIMITRAGRTRSHILQLIQRNPLENLKKLLHKNINNFIKCYSRIAETSTKSYLQSTQLNFHPMPKKNPHRILDSPSSYDFLFPYEKVLTFKLTKEVQTINKKITQSTSHKHRKTQKN